MLLAILCFYSRVTIITFISFIVIEFASGHIKELKHDLPLFVLWSVLWPLTMLAFIGHFIFTGMVKLSRLTDKLFYSEGKHL